MPPVGKTIEVYKISAAWPTVFPYQIVGKTDVNINIHCGNNKLRRRTLFCLHLKKQNQLKYCCSLKP